MKTQNMQKKTNYLNSDSSLEYLKKKGGQDITSNHLDEMVL